jgi:ATP-dependent helicase HepA
MIADEVGLGKTIEAASVLKVYLSDKKNKKILICVPDALVEQWKTELAFIDLLMKACQKRKDVL